MRSRSCSRRSATVGKVQPKWRNLTVAEMIESMTGEAMRDLDEAIQAKNAKQFAARPMTISPTGAIPATPR